MLPLWVTAAGSSLSYAALAGNTGIAFTQNASTNTVFHSKTVHRVVSTGSNIRFTFANWVLNGGGEIKVAAANSWYDFTLRAGVKYNGVFYALTFSGSRDGNCPFGSWITSDPLPITVTAGTFITCYNRRTANNLTASSYNVIVSHQTHAGFGEGVLSGTDTSVDYTTGGMPGGDVASISLGLSSGTTTAAFADSARGSGYTGAPSLTVLDPRNYNSTHSGSATATGTSASGQPVITVSGTTNLKNGMLIGGHPSIPAGATVVSFVASTSITISANLTGTITAGRVIGYVDSGYPGGVGFSAFCNLSSGVLTSITQQGKGFNYSSRAVGAISGGGGFGQTTAGYGPCAITGIPAVKGVTLQLIGHSITRGCGADDAVGDEYRNFGVTERAFASLYPSIQCSYIGNTLTGISGSSNYALTYAMVASVAKPTHVYIQNGTNDFAGLATLAAVKANISSIVTREKALGKKVIVETTPPRTTSTDSWATTANQTPVAGGFEAGGLVDQYDTWLLAGNSGADYVFDVRPMTRDATLTDRWAVDATLGALTGDGIHPLPVDMIALAMSPSLPVLTA